MKQRDTDKHHLERILRKLFNWQPDETGRKNIVIDLNRGHIAQAIEERSARVADLNILK